MDFASRYNLLYTNHTKYSNCFQEDCEGQLIRETTRIIKNFDYFLQKQIPPDFINRDFIYSFLKGDLRLSKSS